MLDELTNKWLQIIRKLVLLFGACLILTDLPLSVCLEIPLCVMAEKSEENGFLIRVTCTS